MSLDYEEARDQVTGPGQLFEVVDESVDGGQFRLFKNAPANLGQLFAGARGEQSTFLVYEDERWTFGESMRRPTRWPTPWCTPSASARATGWGSPCGTCPSGSCRSPPSCRSGPSRSPSTPGGLRSEIDYAVGDAGLSLLIGDPERIARAQHPAAGPRASRWWRASRRDRAGARRASCS